MSQIVDVFITGLISGAGYAVMAAGFALIYGVSKIFNLSYGVFYTMGGYLTWLCLVNGLGYPATVAIVLPALFFIGTAMERFTIRPVRAMGRGWELPVAMITLGTALLLENLFLGIFGPYRKPVPPLFEGVVHVAGITMFRQDIVIAVIAISTIAGLWFFLMRTKEGLAMQAVAQDVDGARIAGIDSNRVLSYTFGLACALVGIAAIVLAPKHSVGHAGGWPILIKAWTMTAFGGMGSITGAIYAAFILGIVEAFIGWQLGLIWTTLVWFAILIGVFIIRPQGLRGTWG